MARTNVRSACGGAVALLLFASLLVHVPAHAEGSWSYPRLRLAVGHHDGKVYVGAQAWASDGCKSLVGSARGRRIRHRRWRDNATPLHEWWWWEPKHGLIAHVWYGRPEAIERVSDRVDEDLRERGARTFHTPDGWVIAGVGRHVSAPGHRGKDLAGEWTEDLRSESRTRVYPSAALRATASVVLSHRFRSV